MDWFEPYRNNSIDRKAAERRHQFSLGWFLDPLVFGSYPKVMRDHVGSRLPVFSHQQSLRLKGAFDFIGFNHYSSKYVKHKDVPRINKLGWFDDVGVTQTPYSISKVLIGPVAHSSWLHVVPWGFYKSLKWIRHRYHNPILYITENGVDDPIINTISRIINDDFRIMYYSGYLAAMDHAIQEGSDIRGYFAWSLIDNFEWASGFECRFGFYYVNYSDPNRNRIPKTSAAWMSTYIQTHTYSISKIRERAKLHRDKMSNLLTSS
jgi:beta-glucosidase/6-phospho-beta-glucosidase/beta-galactosidase